MFCKHKNQTAVGLFIEGKETMVVLKCDRCGEYEVLPKIDMQRLRHTFVKNVDVKHISMRYPYVPCNALDFAERLKLIIVDGDSADKIYKKIDDVTKEFEKGLRRC